MKSSAICLHPHSVQLVGFAVRLRTALFLQLIIDGTLGGREAGWREHRNSLGLAIDLPCDPEPLDTAGQANLQAGHYCGSK